MPTTNFIWDEQNYLAEADANDVVQTVYTNEPQFYGNSVSTRISGTPSYHHFDAIGSTRQLSSNAGSVSDTVIYDAWGNVMNRTGTTGVRLLWIGLLAYYSDLETGIAWVRRRALCTVTGRWVTPDPMGIVDGPNRFRYAGNRPVTLVDPAGLMTFDVNSKNCTVTMRFLVKFDFKGNWGPNAAARQRAFRDMFKATIEECWNSGQDKLFAARERPCRCPCPDGWTPLVDIREVAGGQDNLVHAGPNPGPFTTTGDPAVPSRAGDKESTIDEGDFGSWSGSSGVWPIPGIPPQFWGAVYRQTTACHEFGHMIGLRHPGAPRVRPIQYLLEVCPFCFSPDVITTINRLLVEYEYAQDAPAMMGLGMELRPSYFNRWLPALDAADKACAPHSTAAPSEFA